MPGPKRRPIEDRFAEYLVKNDDDCWGWTGPVTNGGYPAASVASAGGAIGGD